MAISQPPTEPAYRCPRCPGTLALEHGSWYCEECGHAPRHGAD